MNSLLEELGSLSTKLIQADSNLQSMKSNLEAHVRLEVEANRAQKYITGDAYAKICKGIRASIRRERAYIKNLEAQFLKVRRELAGCKS